MPETTPRTIPSTGQWDPALYPPHGEPERHDRGRRRQHPDGRRSKRVARGLEPDVPREVQDGRDRDEADDPGVHPRTLPADVAPRQAERADGEAADHHDQRHHDPDRVEDPGDRLAEVLVEREVEDDLGQLERGPEGIDQERGDDQECRDARGPRQPEQAPGREPDGRERRSAARPRMPTPAIGVRTSPPCEPIATPISAAMTIVTTPIAASLRRAHYGPPSWLSTAASTGRPPADGYLHRQPSPPGTTLRPGRG